MKQLITFLLFLCATCSISFAQGITPPQGVVRVTALPATCVAVGADNSSAPVRYRGVVYTCTATNTWSDVTGTVAENDIDTMGKDKRGVRAYYAVASLPTCNSARRDITVNVTDGNKGSRTCRNTTGSTYAWVDDRPIYDVTYFGAKGDGSIGDAAIIDSLVATVPDNAVIYFPAGRYKCNIDTVTSVGQNLTFRGVTGRVTTNDFFGTAAWASPGASGSILMQADDTKDLMRLGGVSGKVHLENLTLQGLGTGTKAGIHVLQVGTLSTVSMVNMMWRDINVFNFYIGVHTEQNQGLSVNSLNIRGSRTGLKFEDWHGSWNDVRVETSSYIAIDQTAGNANKFTNGLIQGCTGLGFQITSGDKTTVDGMYWENTTSGGLTYNVKVLAGSENKFVNLRFGDAGHVHLAGTSTNTVLQDINSSGTLTCEATATGTVKNVNGMTLAGTVANLVSDGIVNGEWRVKSSGINFNQSSVIGSFKGTATASASSTVGIFQVKSSSTNDIIFGALNLSPFSTYIQSGGSGTYPLTLNPLGGQVQIGSGQLTFTGFTSSFPMLKRNGTGMDLRLSDDSASGGLFSAGSFTANTGDMAIGTAGKTLQIKTGSNACAGWATLSSGSVVVSTTCIGTLETDTGITLTPKGSSTGVLRISATTASTSFTITSTDAASSDKVYWQITKLN